ncbi:DUF4097 family beta strand repeat-containing protein [Actinomadura rupiterrae]|uniref:DUF4097 family beta strand repeat-containing protein n=1 Tax=Actinomadura rupiterrae TaxID=559627 RepID=UPI0020A34FF3|nr:DUF4097 family beta strand repeat-containing protein [Actinomadura rupiterrae]MCP2340468.1 hypothetical protein [Actinomadura rupiterrae]
MSFRTLSAPKSGPVYLSVDLPVGSVEVISEPGRTVAEVTVTATGTDAAFAEAVQDAILLWDDAREALMLRVPEVMSGAQTIIQTNGSVHINGNAIHVGRGTVVTSIGTVVGDINIGDQGVTINGVTVNGTTVVGADAGSIQVTARVPELSSIIVKTLAADLDAYGTYEGIKFDSSSGNLRAERTRHLLAETRSGDVRADVAEHANVSSTSGDVRIGRTVNVLAKSTSGDIDVRDYLSAGTSGIASLTATSGDITITATGPGTIEAFSTSGDVDVTAGPMCDPDSLRVDARSRVGRVRTPAAPAAAASRAFGGF